MSKKGAEAAGAAVVAGKNFVATLQKERRAGRPALSRVSVVACSGRPNFAPIMKSQPSDSLSARLKRPCRDLICCCHGERFA